MGYAPRPLVRNDLKPEARPSNKGPAMRSWDERFSPRGRRAQASEIRELLKLLDRPGLISFAGGIPAPEVFPVDAIRRAYAGVLGDRPRAAAALQYSISEGSKGLRQ